MVIAGHVPGVVLDDTIRASCVDAVDEVRAGAHGDVVDHVANNLNTNDFVAAAIGEDARIAARAGQVMDAIPDHLVVIAVHPDSVGTVPGDVEVDDLDVIAAVPNGVTTISIDLRAPFHIGDIGDVGGGRTA